MNVMNRFRTSKKTAKYCSLTKTYFAEDSFEFSLLYSGVSTGSGAEILVRDSWNPMLGGARENEPVK